MQLYDAQVRFGESIYGYGLTIEPLLEQMARFDVARALLCPVRPVAYDLAMANDVVRRAVADHPGRFDGLMRVDPWHGPRAIEEFLRSIDGRGIAGLYLDPWEDHFTISDPLVDPVIEHARERRLPVMINGGYPTFSHPSQIQALAQRHPDVTFIATHGGQINISGMLLGDAQRMLQACPNIIIETSGIYREDFIEDCVAEFGAYRVIFGSGAPVFDQGFETLRIRLAHLGEDVKQAIGWDNGRRLFGHDGNAAA